MVSVTGPLLQRIGACHDFTPSEQAVAGFYADAYPGVALLKLHEVCAAAGVSTATVIRFARKLGYADFRDLNSSLQAEVKQRLNAPRDRLARLASQRAAPPPAPRALQERFALAAQDLRETARGIDPESFGRFIDLLADADRPLHLGAVASGQPLLRYFALLLAYLRGNVVVLDGTDRWSHELAGLDAHAVVVAEAFDRYPVAVQRLLRYANAKGATTVLLTNRHSSPLVRETDLTLFVASQSHPMFGSRVGLLLLLEAALDALAARLPNTDGRADDIEHFFTVMGGYLSPSE
ncbi:MAG: MurR/RpiR family transcriptional regulator [Propionibacteriaceae bacterium]|nr:MurR/RpiR family transcriptional regulator [Propionibacteriaceae bacterium]